MQEETTEKKSNQIVSKKKRKKKHRFFWAMVRLQIFLMFLVLGAVGYYYFGGYADEVNQLKAEAQEIVDNSSEEDFMPSQTSQVFDIEGNLISERSGEKNAEYVSYEDIPAPFISTIISIEDKKFYKHNGVDIQAIFRAAKAMVANKKITQGGSTITMQLAKLIYMEPDTTWQYKVKQIFIAIDLEKKYTKSDIMEFYLNNIYFANGYYGISAACHGYFDCELNQLDQSQIAFLLAIPNSPSYYDPLTNSENTLERRNLILQNLRDDGKISELDYNSALAEDIVLHPTTKQTGLWNNYVDTYTYRCATLAMMEQGGFTLQTTFDSDQEEENYQAAYDEMYSYWQKKLSTGGYKIYTSIDMKLQEELQDAVDQELAGFSDKGEDGVYELQGAAVCIDNETGRVAAIVGGRSQDYSTYTLNRAFQSHRQPGSSIKPLTVYTPSFETGKYNPTSIVTDQQFEGGPSNSGGTYYGDVEVKFAVAHSLNTVAWKLYEELTPQVGLSYLTAMNFSGIREEDYVMATALGGFTEGVSPLEMAAGYATLENDGLYRNPTCLVSIVDSNENTVYTSLQDVTQIYSETSARMMTYCLEDVMAEGTGSALRLENAMPCAGKTGTTNSCKDGWFVGYTRYYTTSVWVGKDIPEEVEDLKGNTYPGRIWKHFMDKAHEDLEPLDFLPYAQMSQELLDSLQPDQNAVPIEEGNDQTDNQTNLEAGNETNPGDTDTTGTGNETNPETTDITDGGTGETTGQTTGDGTGETGNTPEAGENGEAASPDGAQVTN